METNRRIRQGFTLIELLVVLATLSVLSCLLLPAMAKSRIKSTGAGCLSNLRQMMVGWAMYKDDNKDVLLPNAPVGVGGLGWCNGVENWLSADANTNSVIYLTSLLSPYVNGHIELYHCPADTIPSDNGPRLRSCSMNGMMGTTLGSSRDNVGWRSYVKGSDLICPTPKDTFVFADESMYSLDDGYLQFDLNVPTYPNVPAAYHNGACGISFADGHAEIHKWIWAGTASFGLRNTPYKYGVTGAGQHWPSSPLDGDWGWLRAHTACK